jgi:hypothetical protein
MRPQDVTESILVWRLEPGRDCAPQYLPADRVQAPTVQRRFMARIAGLG